MVEHTSGVICVGMEGATLDRLGLPLMVPSQENEEAMTTAFTITVDAREGTSTGISAADRALTIRLLADPLSRPGDFKKPGHIFPLRYRGFLGVPPARDRSDVGFDIGVPSPFISLQSLYVSGRFSSFLACFAEGAYCFLSGGDRRWGA